MMRVFACVLAAFAVALGQPLAAAKKVEGVFHHEAAPKELKADKAYLLFESSRAKSGIMKITHVLMRIPTEAELEDYFAARKAAYEKALPKLRKKAKGKPVTPIEQFEFRYDGPQNLFAVDMGSSLNKSDTFLIEVPAGEYVIYGVAISSRALASCNCLGTVKFRARAGEITNMGALYADKSHKESPIPHIEDNLGEDMFSYTWVLSQAVVPASDANSLPEALDSFPSSRAEYEPVGMFQDPGAEAINRLAPIPGILEYDRGRVVLPVAADTGG